MDLQSPAFLEQLPEGQWVSVTVGRGRAWAELWLRLEDVDVVEIVVISEAIVGERSKASLGRLM